MKLKLAHLGYLLLLAVIAFGIAGCATTYIPDKLSLQRMTPTAARTFLKEIDLKRQHISIVDDNKFTRDHGGEFVIAAQRVDTIVLTNKKLLFVRFKTLVNQVRFSEIKQVVYTEPFVDVGNLHWLLGETKEMLYIPDPQFAKQVTDAIYIVKETAAEEALKEEARFEQGLQSYLNATAKPEFTEDVRKLKVQAENALRETRNFDAVNLYEKALSIAPWWAEGHFNRAIILSKIRDYETATMEMERYLKLTTDSSKARAAQDKIYEWEGKVK